jgi:putative flippase GtrA
VSDGAAISELGYGAQRAARPPTVASRLLTRKTAVLLARNTVVSCIVFAFGLALLWLLVEKGGVNKLVAATLAFVAANSIHYAFGRAWIYRGTDRAVALGYVYFLINTAVGLAITTLLFAAFLQWTSVHYLVARILVSVVAGMAMFLLNAILNFRRV